MVGGADLYFAQDDNRSTGEVDYRLRVREIDPDRLALETENVSTVRYLLIRLAGPGDPQSVYFLERRSADEWAYYSLARTGAGASSLTQGHEASYVNRAAALFRHVAGLPTDQEPPAPPKSDKTWVCSRPPDLREPAEDRALCPTPRCCKPLPWVGLRV